MKYSETSYLMKQRLAGALEEALKQMPFPKITVSQIVDRCDVNRKTFYYHFSDIHALLCWMFRERFRTLMQPYEEIGDYTALANGVMDYVEENEIIFRNLVDTVGEDGLKRALDDDVHHLQNRVVSGFEIRYSVRFEEEFRAFLVKFLTDAIVGILMDWIRKRKYRSREGTIEYLRDIFRSAIPGLIEHRIHLEEQK